MSATDRIALALTASDLPTAPFKLAPGHVVSDVERFLSHLRAALAPDSGYCAGARERARLDLLLALRLKRACPAPTPG